MEVLRYTAFSADPAGGYPAGGEETERDGQQREQRCEIAGHGGQGPEPGLRRKVGAARILAVFEPRSNTMKLGSMKAQLPWALDEADLAFCHSGGLTWDAAEALAPMGRQASVHGDIEGLVAAVVRAARAGDQVLCMSNGGFGGVHDKLLAALGQ